VNERHCVGCRHGYTEGWAKEKTVIRCGCPLAGKWQGYVTLIYPDGLQAAVKDRVAPAWCPLIEVKKT
jgi:hypothetical protein